MKTHLSIPKPCSEDWAAMTASEKGRFCQSCQKEVVDFSQMSEGEIVAYFKNASGRVCGRLNKDQLDRTLISPPAKLRPLRWLRPELVLASLLAFSKTNLAAKNTPVQQQVWQEEQGSALAVETSAQTSLRSSTIKGKIFDAETGEGMMGVTIVIKGSSIGAFSNHLGAFEITVPASFQYDEGFYLVYTYLGYESIEVYMPLTKGEDVVMKDQYFHEEEMMISLGVVIYQPAHQQLLSTMPPGPLGYAYRRAKSLFYRAKYWLRDSRR